MPLINSSNLAGVAPLFDLEAAFCLHGCVREPGKGGNPDVTEAEELKLDYLYVVRRSHRPRRQDYEGG